VRADGLLFDFGWRALTDRLHFFSCIKRLGSCYISFVVMRRTHEISRLEAFSEAVFAFAHTPLVVSLQVPTSDGELMNRMSGFPAFACCGGWGHRGFDCGARTAPVRVRSPIAFIFMWPAHGVLRGLDKKEAEGNRGPVATETDARARLVARNRP
jgi:hypothetical protein